MDLEIFCHRICFSEVELEETIKNVMGASMINKLYWAEVNK